MKIAILGTRGVPANYGGFETCAEELSVGLVKKGHEVVVYCRKGNSDLSEYKGVKLISLPRINNKYLDTFCSVIVQIFHSLFIKTDIVMVFGLTGTAFLWLPRLQRKKVIINVDGLEWKRKKFNWIAKKYLKTMERLAGYIAHGLVTDSQAIKDYYKKKYNRSSTFIAYGAYINNSVKPEIIKEYNLKKDEYLFIASRLEPENNADITVKAFEGVQTNKKLVIAGAANYKSAFIKELQKTKDPRIMFTGGIYKPYHIEELHCNCYAYVHGNEVGGTNPALLKALGYGNCVLALDVPYNREVIADAGVLYKKSVADLREKMQNIIDNPDMVKKYRKRAQERITAEYTWEKIIKQYEELFTSLNKN
jgi:glycosyltransferase involved in cell wall biosynthesis